MSSFSVLSIKTSIFLNDQELIPFLISSLESKIKKKSELENKVLAITSKIISLSQGQVVSKKNIKSKKKLIQKEADVYLGKMGFNTHLTIKHGLLLASAGIDESNSKKNDYILLPKNPFQTADEICLQLKSHWKLKNFGILITDSKTSPLRAGVTGITLSHSGFKGIQNKIGDKDLFGKKLQMTKINIADALASAAVFCMGESNERTPLALISAPVEFVKPFRAKSKSECIMRLENDMYATLFFKKKFLKT